MNRQRALGILAAALLVALPGAGYTRGVAEGQNEAAGRLSYAHVEIGDVESNDTQVEFSYGRYITDMHQLGVMAGYFKQEVVDVVSADGTTLGAFYALHFPTSGTMTPYVGLNAAWIGGDLGDLYDLQYGVGAGLKIYPYEHAGVNVGIAYQRLQVADDFDGLIDDADGLSFNVGLLIRFGGSDRDSRMARPASSAAWKPSVRSSQMSIRRSAAD